MVGLEKREVGRRGAWQEVLLEAHFRTSAPHYHRHPVDGSSLFSTTNVFSSAVMDGGSAASSWEHQEPVFLSGVPHGERAVQRLPVPSPVEGGRSF